MKPILGLAAAGAALILSACTPGDDPGREAAIEQIMQTDRDFAALAAEQGVQAAFDTYMDAVDGRLVRASGAPVRGAAAIHAEFASFPEGVLMHWYPVEGFASEAGDFGVTWGEWSVHADGDIRSRADERGRYVTVWHRDAAGEWRGVLDLGNEDASYLPTSDEDDSHDAAGDN